MVLSSEDGQYTFLGVSPCTVLRIGILNGMDNFTLQCGMGWACFVLLGEVCMRWTSFMPYHWKASTCAYMNPVISFFCAL